MNEETQLIAFKSICNFINDLEEVFKPKSLKLYKRLINKTPISNTTIIQKHITIFQNFCTLNREAIHSQDPNLISSPRMQYSDNVYIDMSAIFKMAESDNLSIIWQHLLTISAILDPTGRAKEILKKNAEKLGNDETDFLTNIISKVEQNVKPDANPMEAVTSIMQSGVFTEMLTGMQGGLSTGKLDISKLLGAVQSMVGNLSEQAGDDPQSRQAIGMINNLTSMMGNSQQPPDMANMMSMLVSGMSNLNTGSKIEDITENK